MEGSLEYSRRKQSFYFFSTCITRITMASEALQLFSRPSLHLTPSQGWMNDPCAPGYDPIEEKYHIFYQCKYPKSTSCLGTMTDKVEREPR